MNSETNHLSLFEAEAKAALRFEGELGASNEDYCRFARHVINLCYEVRRLRSDRRAFAEETQKYRDQWLSDQKKIGEEIMISNEILKKWEEHSHACEKNLNGVRAKVAWDVDDRDILKLQNQKILSLIAEVHDLRRQKDDWLAIEAQRLMQIQHLKETIEKILDVLKKEKESKS